MDTQIYNQQTFDDFWKQNPLKESMEFTLTEFNSLAFPKDMKRQTFFKCVFNSCKFNDVNISLGSFMNCSFKNCEFKNTKAVRTNFFNSTFETIEFFDSDFSSASFISARFNHVTAEKCDFIYANFIKSNYERLINMNCNIKFTLMEYEKKEAGKKILTESLDHEVIKFFQGSYQKLNVMNQLLIDRLPGTELKLILDELSECCNKILPETESNENKMNYDVFTKTLQLHSEAINSLVEGKGKIADFSGHDLSGYSFQELDMKDAVFINCCLDHCNFSGCNVVGCNFSNSSMKETNFFKAIFGKNDFSNVDLKTINLDSKSKRLFEEEGLLKNSSINKKHEMLKRTNIEEM